MQDLHQQKKCDVCIHSVLQQIAVSVLPLFFFTLTGSFSAFSLFFLPPAENSLPLLFRAMCVCVLEDNVHIHPICVCLIASVSLNTQPLLLDSLYLYSLYISIVSSVEKCVSEHTRRQLLTCPH